MKSKLYLVFMLFLSSMLAFGQQAASVLEVIPLQNPSFEGIPRHSNVPWGWYDCGFPGESPPDTQPDATFGVSKSAYYGNTCLGLVVRDNDTYESVSQKLPEALKADNCYTLSVFAARSESYVSISRMTGMEANYNTPALIRIWGGFYDCDTEELLGVSALITYTKWIEIKFNFNPKRAYTHLRIEAYYKIPTLFPYNGNILLDNVTLYKGCQSGRVGN